MDADKKRALIMAAIVQVVLLFAASMLLDGGETLQIISISSIGFWASIGVLLIRTRKKPELGRLELAYITAGVFPVVIIGYFIVRFIWYFRGGI
ncbi:MAG: hypothetical protein ABIF71_06000 [Planctomycetota bacterium]